MVVTSLRCLFRLASASMDIFNHQTVAEIFTNVEKLG